MRSLLLLSSELLALFIAVSNGIPVPISKDAELGLPHSATAVPANTRRSSLRSRATPEDDPIVNSGENPFLDPQTDTTSIVSTDSLGGSNGDYGGSNESQVHLMPETQRTAHPAPVQPPKPAAPKPATGQPAQRPAAVPAKKTSRMGSFFSILGGATAGGSGGLGGPGGL